MARGVFAEIAAGRGAFLDAKAIPDFAQRFPGVTTSCRSAGIDPQRDLIPVAPAAHYHMGGVATDARGRTSLEGLWAAGEVACTGAHGANRLASNSLLEAVVFAGRIAEDIAGLPAQSRGHRAARPCRRTPCDRPIDPTRERALRDLMSAHVGVIRDADGLKHALAEIARIERDMPRAPQLRNMATAALLVTAAALAPHREPRRAFPLGLPEQRSRAGDSAPS